MDVKDKTIVIKATFTDDIRRFELASANFSRLRSDVGRFYSLKECVIKYQGQEGDLVTLSSKKELVEVVRDASEARQNDSSRPVIRLVVSSGPSRPAAFAAAPAVNAASLSSPNVPLLAPNVGSEPTGNAVPFEAPSSNAVAAIKMDETGEDASNPTRNGEAVLHMYMPVPRVAVSEQLESPSSSPTAANEMDASGPVLNVQRPSTVESSPTASLPPSPKQQDAPVPIAKLVMKQAGNSIHREAPTTSGIKLNKKDPSGAIVDDPLITADMGGEPKVLASDPAASMQFATGMAEPDVLMSNPGSESNVLASDLEVGMEVTGEKTEPEGFILKHELSKLPEGTGTGGKAPELINLLSSDSDGKPAVIRRGTKRKAHKMKPQGPIWKVREKALARRFDVHQDIKCSGCGNKPIYRSCHTPLTVPTFNLCSLCFRNSAVIKRGEECHEYHYPWEQSAGAKEVPGAPLSFRDTNEQVTWLQKLLTDIGIIQPRHKYILSGQPTKHYHFSVIHFDESTADFVRDLRKVGGLHLHDGYAVYDEEALRQLLILTREHRGRRR